MPSATAGFARWDFPLTRTEFRRIRTPSIYHGERSAGSATRAANRGCGEAGTSTALLRMTTMLPLQMVSIRTLGIGDPEKRLMAAVLKDAIQMYQALAGRPMPGLRMHLRQLEDWFASEDVVYPFAFRRICEALSLDPGWVRDGLTRRHPSRPGETAALAS
jgi:hypothetical protein